MSADLLKLCASAIDMDWVKKHTLALNALERSTANKDYLKSTDYVMEVMKEAGFSQIERYALPCDGVTTYDDCTMPLAWDRTGRSTLEEVSPRRQLLADTDTEPINAVIWSPPTPPEGVTAELVSLRSAVSDDWHELRGKIVLWDSSPSAQTKLKLAECGALGIAAYVKDTMDTNPDDVRWMNGAGLRGWYYTKDDPQMWVFSITPRRGNELEERLAAGEKITVKAVMNTLVAPGEVYTVTGLIPGKSREEHALIAHLYEPFIADDSAGGIFSIAVGKALKELAEQNKISPLEKGLRVVFSMERYGFFEFFHNRKRSGNIISLINMDSVCHCSLKLAGVPLELRHSSATAPHFEAVILRNMLSENFPQFAFSETPGNFSDDTFSADSAIGIPCCWLHTPPPPGRHHNTGAIFNEADWELGAAVMALMTAYHAKLCNAAAGTGTQELLKEISEGVFADAGKDFQRLAEEEHSAEERRIIGEYLLLYHTRRLTAFNRTVPGAVDEKAVLKALEEIRARAGEGTDGPSSVPQDHPARKWIISRVPDVCQLMSFAKVPREKRYRNITMPTMLCLSLLDGKRTLFESCIIADFFLKRTPCPNEADALLETFAFLGEYGYYTINKQ